MEYRKCSSILHHVFDKTKKFIFLNFKIKQYITDLH